MHELNVIVHRFAAAPWLVPVITNTPYVASGLRVSQDGAGSLVDEVTVVIPGDYLLITQPFPFHCRSKKVFQKVSLVLREENTRLPFLRRHGVVLNRNAPDWYAFFLICLNEPGVIVGPGMIKLRLQFATMKHIVVVLHECRWTPGAAKEGEFTSGRGQRLFDKGNPKLLVVADTKGLQLLIAFVYIGVAATRKIAAVNVGSSQRVTDAVA